jgi:Fic family protein
MSPRDEQRRLIRGRFCAKSDSQTLLQRKPIIAIPATAKQLSLSPPTVAKALQHMVELGPVRETTGKQRNRLFTYHRYLNILNGGTELPKPSP